MITHHDSDHISRLTHVLESETVGVQHIYHNGLATFAPGARGSPSAGLPTGLGVHIADVRVGVAADELAAVVRFPYICRTWLSHPRSAASSSGRRSKRAR